MDGFLKLVAAVALGILMIAGTGQRSFADSAPVLSKGETVYVPVYSNVLAGPKEVPIHLANSLILRNTDLHHPIQITSADYFDTKGTLIKKFYEKNVTLAPLETKYLYLSERDKEGGIGANFIIRWSAANEVNPPIIECLMVGSQGRAFVVSGKVIKE